MEPPPAEVCKLHDLDTMNTITLWTCIWWRKEVYCASAI